MQLYRPEMEKTNQKCEKPARNAIVPAGNAKNQREMRLYQPEMQKTSEKCDCTSRKCEKPTRNVKNRREMRYDAVDSKSGTFLPFLPGRFPK